jgi:predicted transcriptional regulator
VGKDMVNQWYKERRRSRIQIAANILKTSRTKDTSESELRKSVNISPLQTQKYTTWLVELRLLSIIKKDNICTYYRSTTKGQSLVSVVDEVEHLLGASLTKY